MKTWKDNNPLKVITEERHIFKDFEGYLILDSQEERDKVVEFINANNQDFLNGQIDEATPYEENYGAESPEEEEEFAKTVEIRGATDTFLENLVDDLIEQLQDTLDVSVEDYDIDYTGYDYE